MEVGNKVVCIKTVKSTNLPIIGPREGKIYTIRDVFECTCGNIAFHVGFSILNFPPIPRFEITCSCGRIHTGPIMWCGYKHFAPLLSDLAQKAIDEIHKYDLKEIEAETI